MTPEFLELDIVSEHIEQIAPKLSSSQFGHCSQRLRETISKITRWLANITQCLASHRAQIAGKLIALAKMPSIRPIGNGEVWQRLMSKIVQLELKKESSLNRLSR